MNSYIWCETETFGKLAVEEILVFSDVPELFVCHDENSCKFLALLLDGDCVYLLVKVDNFRLLDMLTGKVTMEQTFRRALFGVAYYLTFTSENIFVEKKDIGDIPNTDLPDECIYFSLQNQKIISYISKLETELIFGNTVSLPDTEQNKGRKFSAMHELTISNHYNWGLGKNEEQFSIYKSDFDQLGLSA